MNLLLVLFIYIAAIVCSSLQASPEEAKQAIEAARKDAEKRLIATEPHSPEILDDPIAKLKDLERGGKDSVDLMVSYKGPGDRNKAIDSSISFWKEKMEEIIKPFIDNEASNKLLTVDYAGPLPDPPPRKPELKEEYRRVEEETKKIVEEAESAFRKEYDRVTGQPPATVEDVAKSTWKKVAASWPLNSTIDVIRRQEDVMIKYAVDNGNFDEEKETLQRLIRDWGKGLMEDLKEIEKA